MRESKSNTIIGFWISTTLSFLMLFALAFVSHSCRTKKDTVTKSDTQIEKHQTESVIKTSNTLDWEKILLSWMADSMSFNFTCDSIVTSDGTIYRPSVETTTSRPKLDISNDAVKQGTDSMYKGLKADTFATISSEKEVSAESVVITEPPNSRWFIIAGVIAVLGFVSWRIIKRLK